jgi:hypothetical protein
MDIKEFAEAYRLRVKYNGVESLIHGKYGELADMCDAGRFRLRLLAVPRAADMDRKLRSRRKAALAGGLELKWKGEAESIFLFNPTDPTQVQLVVKLVGAKVRRRRVLTPEQRQALADRLVVARARKAAPTMAVLDGNSHTEAPIHDLRVAA